MYRGRSLRSAPLAALLVVALAALAPASAAAAPALSACSGQDEFGCATLDVPLDRTGTVPGTVPLHYAVQRSGPKKVLIALSGGPGQSAVSSASSFAISLDPALRRYRLAVLDQRGTGKSGVLSCPNLQRLRSLDAYTPQAMANCANRIGPRRAFYTTADTVLDIDALRQALGADKIALMGISYGTHVALQYARAFPEHVDRLILDSIVGPDGPDAFLLDTYRNMPRVLAEQCAHGACRNATKDPVADVGALVRRINAGGPLRGSYYDADGRKRATRYSTPDELSFLLIAGDLNPFLQAALPAAISAARRGDTAPLMRLRRIGQGGPTRQEDLSVGLNVTTGCTDVPLPFPRAASVPDRAAIAQQALAAIPPTDYDPFDAQTVLRTSYVDDCLAWPDDAIRAPFTGPLPDVPALLLGGRLDTRTPLENARATAQELPHSTIVALKGSGHDALDSDITGCTAQALARFIEDVAVGHPCLNRDNGVAPTPLPPHSLNDFRSAPGVGGSRGRALFAVLDTVTDARLAALQTLFAGLQVRGGGLRGGSFSAQASFEGRLRLRGYAFVPGLRVSGSLASSSGAISGTVHVSGTANGTLKISRRGAVTGTLGGRHVRYRRRGGRRRRRCARAARCGRGRSRRGACRECPRRVGLEHRPRHPRRRHRPRHASAGDGDRRRADDRLLGHPRQAGGRLTVDGGHLPLRLRRARPGRAGVVGGPAAGPAQRARPRHGRAGRRLLLRRPHLLAPRDRGRGGGPGDRARQPPGRLRRAGGVAGARRAPGRAHAGHAAPRAPRRRARLGRPRAGRLRRRPDAGRPLRTGHGAGLHGLHPRPARWQRRAAAGRRTAVRRDLRRRGRVGGGGDA